MEDAILAAAAAKGDQEAFTTLIERYRAYIYTIAWRIALNEEDALDIAQNVLLRLVEKIALFQNRGPFRAWLATLAAREAVSFLRRAGRRPETAVDPAELENLAGNGNDDAKPEPWEELETEQRKERIERAMQCLSPQQRAVFMLRYSEDLRPAAIAEQLGVPPRQVRSQLHRAIERLRDAVRQEMEEKK